MLIGITPDKIHNDNDEHQKTIAIAFNNHYAGFDPQFANAFLKVKDKPVLDWTKELEQ
ncbi:MAG TPA: hypothetical protein VIY08_00420 [Candidatus Nitrosocosmicus sp.]